jgi:hypothetical protein
MFQSHVIEITGIFAGVAISIPGKFRFLAIDHRVADLDATEWPTLSDIRRVVHGVMARNGHLPAHAT